MTQTKEGLLKDVEKMADHTLNKEHQTTSVGDNHFAGFTFPQGHRVGYLVTKMDEGDLVVSFNRETETINRNSPRLQETENTHVEAHFYLLGDIFSNISESNLDELIEKARELTKDSTPDSKGWMYGHRLPTLEDAIDDL